MKLSLLHNISIFTYIVRNEALRVAFIDEVETLRDGKVHTEFYSKLVKADINGKDKVNSLYLFSFNIYALSPCCSSIKLAVE